ncbi:MAG: tetratricopeptide repeat protein, partial [Planctomycetes bacterium]|nr:tetratricopeptide repeat protein [Planctomycetota bacterium]
LVLMNYGSLLSIRGDHKDAVVTLQQCHNMAKSSGAVQSQAEALVNLGNAYGRAGNNKQALVSYHQAEQRLGKNPSYNLQVTLLYNWILALGESGEIDAARSRLSQLRKIARKNDRQVHSLLERIGPLLQKD